MELIIDSQSYCDSAFRDLILTVQAFGVDAEEHFDAVAGPFGDLGGSHSPVEPG